VQHCTPLELFMTNVVSHNFHSVLNEHVRCIMKHRLLIVTHNICTYLIESRRQRFAAIGMFMACINTYISKDYIDIINNLMNRVSINLAHKYSALWASRLPLGLEVLK